MTVRRTTSQSDLLDQVEIRFVESDEELAIVREVRRRVFGVEQGISDAADPDPDDPRSLHVLAVLPVGAVGCGRLTLPSHQENGAQISWIATLPEYRRQGIGSAIMRALLAAVDSTATNLTALSAQTHALDFYRQFGFLPYGDRFVMRGIEHQLMYRWRPGSQWAEAHPDS
ncbi:MAG: GNAT family N-acetyltransferase [Thermomicrobiales bacterium]